jgi:GntR family transcriptional regulator
MHENSPALQIRIQANEGAPIYLQIVNAVKFLVASGRLSPGDELPAIRTLAEKLVVNPNTVARAYRELQVAGVLENRRTAGTYVAERSPKLSETERKRILSHRIDGLLVEARQLDVPTHAVIELIQERDAKLSEQTAEEALK